PFFINDDVELITILEVDGIHVGQDDMNVKEIRTLFPHIHIGLSISNQSELSVSPLSLIDYVGDGPIFQTTTKSDAKEAVGIDWIQTLRTLQPDLPIVAIGGINPTNAPLILKAGANGVAFISVVTKAENIAKVV